MKYQRIRDLREDADLSQREMAEKLHMHKTTYARYESGEREVPLNVAVRKSAAASCQLGLSCGADQKRTIKNTALKAVFF